MTDKSSQLTQTLQASGQSVTRTRQLIFNALQDKEPQTMHELVLSLTGSVDRASIYRTIDLFERLGIVQRLQIGWKYKLELSNAFQEHHHHLTCIGCDKVIPLHEDAALEKRLMSLAAAQNFSAQDHQLEIRGLCSECQKNNKKIREGHPRIG